MREMLRNHLLIILGWVFVALALVGVVLPILPTTPLLIVALALFSKSSPRFHRMLLNNPWVGPGLQRWEATRTIARKDKIRATIVIVLTFTLSVAVVRHTIAIQLLLVCIGVLLLFFLWRIRDDA